MDETHSLMAFIAVIIAIVFICIPFRTIIYKFCLQKQEASEDPADMYMGKYQTFDTDYDKENPISKRNGFVRVLSM